ncbi:flagellar hook-basal body complex protein FliE [bacterium]|nr:MAG: flagellar hook-basal body complex protein FliE [bacterium]
MAIGGIKSLGSIDPAAAYGIGAPGKPAAGPSFVDQLQSAMGEVQELQTRKSELVEGMVAGEVSEVHDVMVAAKEAQLAFELLLEVRNKLLEGYQELMRMQV